ncbi:MAG: NAD(P)-dependent oxidoreductase [Bryobacteraceae bacterium]|nr:NAD(P)-dependent oxidoreductase [Bryobacteraceae bacterium]
MDFSHSEKENRQPVGLLGAGLVGGALAVRLVAARYPVVVYDPSPEALARARSAGAIAGESAAAVARECRRLVLSLPSATEVRQTIDALNGGLRPGDAIIDTTTGDPDQVEAIANALAARGVAYLDATLGGSSRQIAAGEAIVICGSGGDAFPRALPILETFGARVFHTGPPGTGTRMKLVLNMAIGLHRAALAETLEFARHSGIDPERAFEILKAGPAYSRAMDTKGRKMIEGDFEPEARLAQHWKDVRLMLDAAASNGAHLPLTKAHEALLREAVELGFGSDDNSAVIEVYREKTK